MNLLNLVLFTGSLMTLVLGATICFLLRALVVASSFVPELPDRSDFSWKPDRFLPRLLAPADFQFLRDCGSSRTRIKKLKAARRKIYRLCLRRLAREFHKIYQALNAILLQCEADRPDLAMEMARQRIAFYRNLALAEVCLVLHAWGLERLPAIDLLPPLESLSAHLRELVPAKVAMG